MKTQPTEESRGERKSYRIAGWSLTGLTILFMLFDSLSKLALESHVVEATTRIGYPLAVIRPIGWVLLACTILYAIPRTAVLGAILLTGFMGGAIASKVRIEDPLFSSVLFGLYFGVILWTGLYLRDGSLRALIPFTRGGAGRIPHQGNAGRPTHGSASS
jgi:DoxX-like family